MPTNNPLLEAKVNKALEWLAENPSLSFRQVGEALGTPSAPSHWYSRNTCGFRDRYDEILKDSFAALEAPAIKCMSDLITQDRNFQAAKYVLDNRGYKATEKVEAKVDNTVDININIEE